MITVETLTEGLSDRLAGFLLYVYYIGDHIRDHLGVAAGRELDAAVQASTRVVRLASILYEKVLSDFLAVLDRCGPKS